MQDSKSTGQLGTALTSEDVRELYDNVSRTEHLKPDYLRAIKDLFKVCCRKERESRIRHKAFKRVDQALDIRSFANV